MVMRAIAEVKMFVKVFVTLFVKVFVAHWLRQLHTVKRQVETIYCVPIFEIRTDVFALAI